MKVYIVVNQTIFLKNILGVFSMRQAALNFIENNRFSNAVIIESELDPHINNTFKRINEY
jgi:hypothetical protein